MVTDWLYKITTDLDKINLNFKLLVDFSRRKIKYNASYIICRTKCYIFLISSYDLLGIGFYAI